MSTPGSDQGRRSAKELRAATLAGIVAGAPSVGPQTVHIDITNACNAACITCWDHSPLLATPRPMAWKRKRMRLEDFETIVTDLESMDSVRSLILSGMGEPLVHPDIYRMIARAKAAGWHVTILSNLVAAHLEALLGSGVDQVLAGVHGVTPKTYMAFHPGWDESDFATLCRMLRGLARAGIAVKHVQVINRDNAHELVDMVRFGKQFSAARVNFKLASLDGGTEAASIDETQLRWLATTAVPHAIAAAAELGVTTNLQLFSQQLAGAQDHLRTTTPIDEIGCFVGYAYTRITVDLDALFCCNTQVFVGSVRTTPLSELWFSEAWQARRDSVKNGQYFAGCDRCGKFEQNQKWSERVRAELGEAAWLERTGRGPTRSPSLPRTGRLLPVVSAQ